MVPVSDTEYPHAPETFYTRHFLDKNFLRATELNHRCQKNVTVGKAIPFGNIPRELLKFTTESLIGSILINSASKERAKAKMDDNFTSEAQEIFAKL